VPASVYSEGNPFTVSASLEKHVDEGFEKHTLKISLNSNSKDAERYLIKINIPSSDIKNTSLKNSYAGSIQPLDSDSVFVEIEPLNEGKGQIKVTSYRYISDTGLDAGSARDWLFDYSIGKDDTGKFLVYISSSPVNKNAEGEIKDLDTADIGSAIYDNGDEDLNTKIVVNESNRNNNFLRYLLFVLSFFILGYLVYRIVKED